MANIHPTAIVDAGARLAPDVQIGPYALIGPQVEIGEGTTVGAHAVIKGHTRIGKNNRIFQFVSLGEIPQDKKYNGEPTRLQIGDNNTIREFCTLNTGTAQDAGVTRLGNNNWIMAYVHVAHDCQIGDNTIFANSVQLAGHVQVGDFAILGGITGVHQFCRIGAHVITSGSSLVLKDIPPYVMASGNPANAVSINAEGLKRRGFTPEAIAALRRAYKTIYRSGVTVDEALAELRGQVRSCAEIQPLIDFLAVPGRGIVR
jgi:UDP-N-acetylglucosamine acyltransferase